MFINEAGELLKLVAGPVVQVDHVGGEFSQCDTEYCHDDEQYKG